MPREGPPHTLVHQMSLPSCTNEGSSRQATFVVANAEGGVAAVGLKLPKRISTLSKVPKLPAMPWKQGGHVLIARRAWRPHACPLSPLKHPQTKYLSPLLVEHTQGPYLTSEASPLLLRSGTLTF